MKVKVKSYEIKNNSRQRTKPKNSKVRNPKLNVKGLGGIKDNRKYVNDTTLSEAEKLSRRMALENMKRKSTHQRSHNKNNLFSKDFDNADDKWDDDPFLLKAKQINELDEGLDESSEDEQQEEDTEKYFANGLFSEKKKKKTLEEVIRDSKVEKNEKMKLNEKDAQATMEANEIYREKIRFLLPEIGAIAKRKSKKDFKADIGNYGDMFQKNFENLIYAQRPAKADIKSIETKGPEKPNDKTDYLKIKRLRKRLVNEGIVEEEDDDLIDNSSTKSELSDSDCSDDEESDEQDDNEDKDDEQDDDEDKDDEQDDKEDKDDDEDEDDEDDNGTDCGDSDGSSSNEESDVIDLVSSEESDEDEDAASAKVDFKDLKRLISTKSKKRKLQSAEGDSDVELPAKVQKVDSNTESKSEIDCFRTLLKMPDLRKDALLVLASEMTVSDDLSQSTITRKLMLATLFQQTLQLNKPHSYSPELIAFLRMVLEHAGRSSTNWLSVKSDRKTVSKNSLVDICNDSSDVNSDIRALSSLFHTANLLLAVLACHGGDLLANRHALLGPLVDAIKDCPRDRYPVWLEDKMHELVQVAETLTRDAAPQLVQKKPFVIVELLEADLEGRFDPAKDLTKSLREKVKKEKRATKKEMKMNVRERITNEVAEGRRQAKLRVKKTMEIVHGISQR